MKVILLFFLILASMLSHAEEEINFFDYSKTDKFNIVNFRGGAINPFIMHEFKKLISDLDPSKETVLNLDGFVRGDILSARLIVHTIKEVCEENKSKSFSEDETCDLTTYLPNDTTCPYVCTIPFLSGSKRISCPSAQIALHPQKVKILFWEIERNPDVGIDVMAGYGVDRSWINDHRYLFTNDRVNLLFPDKLEGSNFITHIDEQCNYLE